MGTKICLLFSIGVKLLSSHKVKKETEGFETILPRRILGPTVEVTNKRKNKIS
jgi:hypothetical protein